MSPLVVCFMILLFVFPTLIQTQEIHDKNSNSSDILSNCIEAERQILDSFKQGLEDPADLLSSWQGTDCCSWQGISCSKQTGHVIKLDLRGTCDDDYLFAIAGNNQSLKGNLNPSLFDLKYLHYLDLSCNDFEGSRLPSSIGSMGRMRYLNLSVSNFSGMVPPHLGNLSKLVYLDLRAFRTWQDMMFSTSSNSNIWVADLNWLARLSLLRYLNLGFVNLSSASNGWLKVTNALSSIKELHFPLCNLHDLPQSASVSNFSSLSVLNLEGNNFNATLPRWLSNVTTLSHLRLQYAGIEGSLDNIAWEHLCNLKSLDTSSNRYITGEITGLIDSLAKCSNASMEELILENSNLQGHLPESLGKLRNLRYLELSANKISGPVPSSIGNLSHLTILDMSANKLNGMLPESIGQLEELVELGLAFNMISGPVPSSIGQLEELVQLGLQGNNWADLIIPEIHFLHLKNLKYFGISSNSKSLAFHVSPNWVPNFSLTEIDMSDCQMDPKYFPFWIKSQAELSRLSLQNVGIYGEIPSWFWKQIGPQLRYLSLSNNHLSGKLPNSLMFSPNVVDLSSNLFEGSLPTFLQVTVLYLRNNSFSGPIPATIGSQMPRLLFLDLSENSLTGKIPTSLGKLRNLENLSLSSNNFSGKIPSLKGLQSLSELDLSHNHLIGNIPQSLCSLPRLETLILNNNNLSGNLAVLRNCSNLSHLRLGDNGFSGNIPRWIGEMMPTLATLSLRGNSFKGTILENLCQLPLLHILDLGDNSLSGTIPSCVGNLTAMTHNGIAETTPFFTNKLDLSAKGRMLTYDKYQVRLMYFIDFSRNNLKGEIPDGLTNLTGLDALNLSHNQLTGNLPEKIGCLARLETLDLSSNHLSGSIPTSITNLTFLSHLNLSYNNLSGPIPTANQFLTFTGDPSIYEGNTYLCGSPWLKSCSTTHADKKNPQGSEGNEEGENYLDMLWLDVGFACGIVVGFWAFFGSLAISKSWRHRFYQFLDKASDRISKAQIFLADFKSLNLNRE